MIDSEATFAGSGDSTLASARVELSRARAEATAYTNELNEASRVGSHFGKVMSTAFTGMALQGRSFNDVLRTVGLSLSKLALDASFKSMGSALARAVVQSATSMSGSSVAFAKGGVLAAGTPIPFASGGIISSPTMFPLGRGAGIAGERGAEAILPLARGPDAASAWRRRAQAATSPSLSTSPRPTPKASAVQRPNSPLSSPARSGAATAICDPSNKYFTVTPTPPSTSCRAGGHPRHPSERSRR